MEVSLFLVNSLRLISTFKTSGVCLGFFFLEGSLVFVTMLVFVVCFSLDAMSQFVISILILFCEYG